jgi:hypothetical protein
MSNIEYIETVRLDYRLGNITEKEAKEKLKNFIKEFNEKSIEKAKKYNVKPKKFNFKSFMR